MTQAFGIGEDDIQAAFELKGRKVTLDEADEIFPKIDKARVQKAALHGNDLEEQTRHAVEDIAAQLTELGLA